MFSFICVHGFAAEEEETVQLFKLAESIGPQNPLLAVRTLELQVRWRDTVDGSCHTADTTL